MAGDLEVADVFRRHGPAFRAARSERIDRDQRRVMGAIEACRTGVLGGHARRCADCDDLAEEVARLRAIVAVFQRAAFGRRSERLDPDQLEFALEEASQKIAEDRAREESARTRPSSSSPP